MSDHQRRLRTAHRFTTDHRLPKPIVIFTIIFWLAISTVAIATPLMFKLTIPVSALGQTVEPDFQTPSLSLCGSAEVIYVGDTIPIAKTETCSPIRWVISIPKQVDLSSIAGSEPKPPTSSSAVNGSPAHIVKPNKPVSWKPAQTIIATQQRAVSSQISASTTGIMMWLIVWLLIGAVECAAAVGVGMLLLNHSRKRIRGTHYGRRACFTFVGSTLAVWLLLGSITVTGSQGLLNATSLDEVFNTTISHLDPPPAGPVDTIDVGASVGNSEAAVYGGPGSKGYCFQSQDSLAELLSRALVPFRNLACTGATITQGLLGPQPDGDPDWRTNAQVGQLKRMANLKFVVVTDGENEVDWAQIGGICFLPDSCSNQFIYAAFQERLKTFAIQYNNLLQALQDLPTHPKVLVNLSYDPFSQQAETDGVSCPAVGRLTAADVQTMVGENDQLNHVLSVGAQEYGFATADPNLIPLCGPGLQDIQPVWSANGKFNPLAFHPLESGEYAIAFADFAILSRWVSSGL